MGGKNSTEKNPKEQSQKEVVFDETNEGPRVKSRRAGINAGSLDQEQAKNFVKKVVDKTPELHSSITQTLKENVLFSALDEPELKDIVDCMFEVSVKNGDNIITQGEDGDNFYVMHEGSADIIVNEKKVADYKDGKGSFGELALIYGSPRAATIKATADMTLYAMDRDTYRYLLMGSVMKKRKLFEEVLSKVEIFQDIELYEKSQIADALESKSYKEGTKIITQGEEGKDFFIIISGEVKVLIDDKEVNTLKESEYFGEIALLNNSPRKATVTAHGGTVTVGKLDKERFERVLGPVENILRRNMENYKKIKSQN